MSYKIIHLHAENVKKIKVVDITPSGDIVTIAGENGNGKSSVLDCIEMALRGKDAIPGMPIRKGEEKALIEMTIESPEKSLTIKRTFTEKGTYITVSAEDGAVYKSPQEMLDKMMGAISYDPLEFTRLKTKEQYETLRRLVKMDVDIDAIDAAIKADEEERTIVGREEKALAAQVAGMVIPENTPAEPVDVTVVSQGLVKAQADITQAATLQSEIEKGEKTIADIKDQMKALEERLKTGQAYVDGREKELADLKPKLLGAEDIFALEESIKNATAINKAVADAAAKVEKAEQHAKVKKKYDSLDASITKRREEKAAAIESAKMPIKGLSFSDGVVLFNKIPLDQASTAEQIRVSTSIAMAMNPDLRVIRIKDGSLLDEKSLEIVRDLAKKNKFQIWMECVTTKDPLAVVIEDGEVAAPKAKKARA